MKYCQTFIDDEYERSNIAQKELGSISGSVNLNHTRYSVKPVNQDT